MKKNYDFWWMVLSQIFAHMFKWLKKCKRIFLAVLGPLNFKKWSLFYRTYLLQRESKFRFKQHFFIFFLLHSFKSIHGAIQNIKYGTSCSILLIKTTWNPFKRWKWPFLAISCLKWAKYDKKWPQDIVLSISLVISHNIKKNQIFWMKYEKMAAKKASWSLNSPPPLCSGSLISAEEGFPRP